MALDTIRLGDAMQRNRAVPFVDRDLLAAQLDFKPGDLVTRDGTDVQLVVDASDDGFGAMLVRCIRPSAHGWCEVGDEEWNMKGRYQYAGDLIEAQPAR